MFDLLENAGASCCSIITSEKNTLLHWFCHYQSNDKHILLLKKLINAGCDINAENNLQHTPLMLAAKQDMINTCHILINFSADINKIDCNGNRAIDLAEPNSQCFKFLQETMQNNKQINCENIDRILWKKELCSKCSLSTKNNENKTKWYCDDKINDKQNHLIGIKSDPGYENEELSTKYKRIWENLLQTKQKIRRSKDLALQKAKDYSQQREKDLSQDKTNDLCRKESIVIMQF